MKTFFVPTNLKYYYEPYLLAYLSRVKENFIILYRDEYLNRNNSKEENIIKVVNDLDKDSLCDDFNYSILPDHGLYNPFNANVYSDNRIARLYLAAGMEYKKHHLYKRHVFFKRTEENVLKDMQSLRLKFNVSFFEIINNCYEAVEFSEKYNINLREI